MVRLALIALGLMMMGAHAFAQSPRVDPETATTNELEWRSAALAALVVHVEKEKDEAVESAQVSASIDRAGLLAALPVLQDHGLLSRKITPRDFDNRPKLHANAIALQLTSWSVHDLYADNARLNATRWSVFLVEPRESQSPGRQEMFSFSFDRASYLALDWNALSFAVFPIKATGFSYNLRFTWEMAQETSGSIDED